MRTNRTCHELACSRAASVDPRLTPPSAQKTAMDPRGRLPTVNDIIHQNIEPGSRHVVNMKRVSGLPPHNELELGD